MAGKIIGIEQPILSRNERLAEQLRARFAENKISCPMLSVITTGGTLPWSTEPNDTIVTVASQTSLKYGKKVEVKKSPILL